MISCESKKALKAESVDVSEHPREAPAREKSRKTKI
jgi:hypothetical protein